MNDKLKQIYDLYLDQGIITEKVSFDMFASADDSKMQQLYDIGKERGLFKSIDSSTFKSAWEVKKKKHKKYRILFWSRSLWLQNQKRFHRISQKRIENRSAIKAT